MRVALKIVLLDGAGHEGATLSAFHWTPDGEYLRTVWIMEETTDGAMHPIKRRIVGDFDFRMPTG